MTTETSTRVGGDGRENDHTAEPAARQRENGDGRGPGPERGARAGRMSRRRFAYWTAGVLAVLLLLVLVLRPSPIPVEAGEVVRGPMETAVEVDGVTRVRDRFAVSAPVSGRLVRTGLSEGDAVEAGQVIGRIVRAPLDPNTRSEAEARLASAQALQREAEARAAQARGIMEQATLRAQRMARVGEAGGLSRESVEVAALESATAQREHAAAISRMDAARAEVAAARIALESDVGPAVDVRAPAAGRILRVYETSDRVIAAGAPVVELGETRRLEIVAEVLSSDAVRIPAGARVRVTGWGGGDLSAAVRLVEPGAFTRVSALGVEEQRVNVIADLAEAPSALGDGYRVEARIVTWAVEDAVKVPASALFRDGDGWSVFVVEDGRARGRAVDIGERNPREAEVIGGLRAGDEVVLYPSDRVDDGVRVRVRAR